MALYLTCVICSRKQADGLISGAAWPRLELPRDATVQHPSVNGSAARVCPTCSGNPGWEEQAFANLGLRTAEPAQ